MTGSRTGKVLPRGMRPGSTIAVESTEDVDHASVVGCGPEINYAMAAVVENAEGLTPTFEEARKRPDWAKWQDAIQTELNSLEKNGTWHLVKRPPNTNIVDSRWVLKIKKNTAGEVDKYKARLVAKGFTQIYGIDYYKTYTVRATAGGSHKH